MRLHFGKVFNDNVYTPLGARIKWCSDWKFNVQYYLYKISHRERHIFLHVKAVYF